MKDKLTLSSLTLSALLLVIQYPSMAGSINCHSISINNRNYDSQLIVQGATLSNSGDGYDLSLKIKGRGEAAKYKVTSNMVVLGTDYHPNGAINSKLTVQKNGAFSFYFMPSSRQSCDVKGKLTFGSGVKQKIFKK